MGLNLEQSKMRVIADDWEMIWINTSVDLLSAVYDRDNDRVSRFWNLPMRRYFPTNFRRNRDYYELKVVLRRLIQAQMTDLTRVIISEISDGNTLTIQLVNHKPTEYTVKYLRRRLQKAIKSASDKFCKNFISPFK